MSTINVVFGWRGLTLRAEGHYTPGDPGHLSGPPEDCWPSVSPEFEFEELWYVDDTAAAPETDAAFLLNSSLFRELEDAVLGQLEVEMEPDYEPYDEPDGA